MTKILATDLDGTLFYPKRRLRLIPSKNVLFLQDFVDEGGRLVLVTGRSPSFATKVSQKINRPFDVIGMNGAYTITNNKVVEEHFLALNLASFIQEISDKYPIRGLMLISHDYPLLMTVPKNDFFVNMFYHLYYFVQGVYKEDYLNSTEVFNEQLESEQVYKMMFFFGVTKKKQNIAREANKYIRKKYGDVIESSWTGGFIEITPHGCSKANGITNYVKKQKLNPDDVYVVGDSGNDISMFRAFHDKSFCMKHAPRRVRKHARYHLRRFHHLRRYIMEEKNE
ncbi:MAG TPA: HAD family hydrolase [Bacilli bacterium]|nr:HAD family hydrolase [Bacilli bacterium]